MPGLPPSGRKKRGKRPADKESPLNLNVIMNLVCILIPALLAQQVTDYYQHQVELPSKGGGGAPAGEQAPTNPPFNLKLTMGADGSFEIVNAKVLTVGESGLTNGPAGLLLPPGAGGTPQYTVLQQLLAKEKEQRLNGQPPEAFPDPDQILLVAPPDTKYELVVQTLDYLRFGPSGGEFDEEAPSMFTVISLSPGSIGG